MTAFQPETHGFAFTNSFELEDAELEKLVAATGALVDRTLGSIGPLGLVARLVGVRRPLELVTAAAIPKRYGLCGGMAFAALDYFQAGLAVPRGNGPDDQPPVGSALRGYLWERLIDSWQLNGVRFLEWIARLHLVPARWPLDGGPRALRSRTRQAWRDLRDSIDAGRPIPIGLVGEAKDPFSDHQVVAYGYAPNSEVAGTVFVYDMNCPGTGQTIAFDLAVDVIKATESCARRENALRGFFCEQYQPRRPPQHS